MAVEQKQESRLADPIQKFIPEVGGHTVTKQEIIDAFHRLSYAAAYEENLTWQRTQWLGFPLFKMPQDLFCLADVIWQVKPKLIIETGTAAGGSALFMACYLDACGHGEIVTIDIRPIDRAYPAHPRINYLAGKSSLDPGILKRVREEYVEFWGGPVIVILDSDHRAEHVSKELEAYCEFVTPGSYLIVEDTNVNGHPVLAEHGPGPFEAVEEFLPRHPDFKADTRVPSFHLFSQHSWLKKQRI